MHTPSRLLSVARGDAPADCVLAGGRVINTFTGEIEQADVAIVDGRIAGVGQGYAGVRRIDLERRLRRPGPDRRARSHREQPVRPAAVRRGGAAARRDGGRRRPARDRQRRRAAGVRFMADAAAGLPLRRHPHGPELRPRHRHGDQRRDDRRRRSAPSCAPRGVVHGLAEVMNFPGVIAGDAEVLGKIAAIPAARSTATAPASAARTLNAYVAAGVGSDHECVSRRRRPARSSPAGCTCSSARRPTRGTSTPCSRSSPPPTAAGSASAPTTGRRYDLLASG